MQEYLGRGRRNVGNQQGKKGVGEDKAGENPTGEYEEKNSHGEEKERRITAENNRKSSNTAKKQTDPDTKGGREIEENPPAGSKKGTVEEMEPKERERTEDQRDKGKG